MGVGVGTGCKGGGVSDGDGGWVAGGGGVWDESAELAAVGVSGRAVSEVLAELESEPVDGGGGEDGGWVGAGGGGWGGRVHAHVYVCHSVYTRTFGRTYDMMKG